MHIYKVGEMGLGIILTSMADTISREQIQPSQRLTSKTFCKGGRQSYIRVVVRLDNVSHVGAQKLQDNAVMPAVWTDDGKVIQHPVQVTPSGMVLWKVGYGFQDLGLVLSSPFQKQKPSQPHILLRCCSTVSQCGLNIALARYYLHPSHRWGERTAGLSQPT
jgi:hypothetical protein